MLLAMIVLALVLAYLVGSIPTAVWLGRALHGVDVRTHGSGNMGATNVFRVLGWKTGLATLLFDIFKGWVAAYLVPTLVLGGTASIGVQLACGVIAILGHSFPLFAGFKGGKGVATSAGVLLAVTPGAFLVALAAFLIGFGLTRYVAVGSLMAAASYPTTLFVERFALGRPVPVVLLGIGTAMGAWLFWTHRSNLARLRAGTERKIVFGQRTNGPDSAP